jgi:hypothetical protein
MPDMTNFYGSDGARYYWLDPEFIEREEMERKYREMGYAYAEQLRRNYRGSHLRPRNVQLQPGGLAGAQYGMTAAGAWSGMV